MNSATDRSAPFTLGAFLRSERETLGLTVGQAANEIGVSHSRLGKFEHDEDKPTIEQARQIVRIFPRFKDHVRILGGAFAALGNCDPTTGCDTFREALYAARDYFATPPDALAKRAGIGLAALMQIENGDCDPSRDAYRALCAYYPCLASVPKPKSLQTAPKEPTSQRLVSVRPTRTTPPPAESPTLQSVPTPSPVAITAPPAPPKPAPANGTIAVTRAAMTVARLLDPAQTSAVHCLLRAIGESGLGAEFAADLLAPEPEPVGTKRAR